MRAGRPVRFPDHKTGPGPALGPTHAGPANVDKRLALHLWGAMAKAGAGGLAVANFPGLRPALRNRGRPGGPAAAAASRPIL